MRTLLALSLVAGLSLSLSAASERPTLARQASRASPESSAAVAIRTFQFTPDTQRVRAGTRVVWTNEDEIAHTITSGVADARDGHFHGVVATRGATYSAAIEKPGTYRYFCDRHPFMNGTIITR